MPKSVSPWLAGAALVGALAFVAAPSAAQDSSAAPAAQPGPPPEVAAIFATPLEEGEGREVAEALAKALETRFTYVEQGAAYAAGLRALSATGRYDQGTRADLAERINADIQEIAPEGHIRIAPIPPQAMRQRAGETGAPRPAVVEAQQWIAPGIAYIRFNGFPGSVDSVAATRVFMREFRDAKAIIVDNRVNGGGYVYEMDEMLPYLFAERTPLVAMEVRQSVADAMDDPEEEPDSMVLTDGNPGMATRTHFATPIEDEALRDARVYVLNSGATASAAEHFALAMKRTGRATLVGEATAGANHFGGMQRLNANFGGFIPIGRTYDPDTGKDWEGDGVAPDVAVPAADALTKALEMEGIDPAEAKALGDANKPARSMERRRPRR